jgi:hypothetical protein
MSNSGEMEMPDDTQNRIQRALNDQKRKDLEEKYGARFSFDDSDAPPEIIGEWLDTVEEFERQFQAAGKTTVRAYAGNPDYAPPSSLPPGQIPRELRRLIDHLGAHAVAVHFDRTVPPAEAYRFIVEELFNMEIDDVRVAGMTHSFVYEDFHPDPEACATMFAGHFLYALFGRDTDACMRRTDRNELYSSSGRPVTHGEMRRALDAFVGGVAVFTGSDVTENGCSVEGDYATVLFAVSWTGLQIGTLRSLSASGMATIRMKRSGIAWNVLRVECPGWGPW